MNAYLPNGNANEPVEISACPTLSTGGSVQFEGKRFPIGVDRHLKLWDLRVATQRCFDRFQDIDPFDGLSLSFRTRFLSTRSL